MVRTEVNYTVFVQSEPVIEGQSENSFKRTDCIIIYMPACKKVGMVGKIILNSTAKLI